ncbi:MAG: antitoxin [Candidatus Heimdallarchaeota archaeon]|nr:antitoxin [Candidatus Heimdallarchaeota archaeon]
MAKISISLSNEVYEKLMKEKKPEESISELILRLLEEKERIEGIEEFAGAFEQDDKEWQELERIIYEKRKDKARAGEEKRS